MEGQDQLEGDIMWEILQEKGDRELEIENTVAICIIFETFVT